MLNDILTLDQQWLPNQSDLSPISWPWYRAWPSPNYEWFLWSICNGCGLPARNAYPSGHLVPSPILGLACAPMVETRFLELGMSLHDFSPRIPLGIFSISSLSIRSNLLKRLYSILSHNRRTTIALYFHFELLLLIESIWTWYVYYKCAGYTPPLYSMILNI